MSESGCRISTRVPSGDCYTSGLSVTEESGRSGCRWLRDVWPSFSHTSCSSTPGFVEMLTKFSKSRCCVRSWENWPGS